MLIVMVLGMLLGALIVPNIFYFMWMKNTAKRDWGLAIDPNFRPKVSLIIATYNEAKVMDKKLKNVQELDYPVDKLEVIIVDSASTDGTLDVCRSFLKKNELRYPVKLLSEEQRLGKSHALNTALQHAKGEVIATSDADSFWKPDALLKAVPFFADPSIGAVTGREVLMNLEKNVYTMSEGIYRDFYYTLRLGESKVNSTLIFDGTLALYRRSILDKFEDRPGYSDDIGTVVNMVSNGYRCIFVPEAIFYDTTACSFIGRLELKSRRAQHLIAGLIQALKFKLNKKLVVPSAVVAFNFYMHVVSPLLFVVVTLVGVVAFILYFSVVWFLLLLALPLLVFHKPRSFVISYLTSNLALIIGLVRHLAGRKEATWRKIEEMRIG
jgi:cellulose synthase/poly-beta-1,6-N-acetylglucosamine synthase-like glycosyltransferase